MPKPLITLRPMSPCTPGGTARNAIGFRRRPPGELRSAAHIGWPTIRSGRKALIRLMPRYSSLCCTVIGKPVRAWNTPLSDQPSTARRNPWARSATSTLARTTFTLRTDAKNQQTRYSYDAYGRLTTVQHYTPNSQGRQQEQPAQDVNYYYDSNPFVGGFSQNAWGRLAAVTFNNVQDASWNYVPSMYYMYSYNQAGRVTNQRMTYSFQPGGSLATVVNWDATYTWDNQGRMTSLGYPANGPQYAYQYDNMGRLSGMTENGNAMATATYTAIGQVSQLTYDNLTESRAYDPVMQLLTRMAAIRQGGLLMDMQYLYRRGRTTGGSRKRLTG